MIYPLNDLFARLEAIKSGLLEAEAFQDEQLTLLADVVDRINHYDELLDDPSTSPAQQLALRDAITILERIKAKLVTGFTELDDAIEAVELEGENLSNA